MNVKRGVWTAMCLAFILVGWQNPAWSACVTSISPSGVEIGPEVYSGTISVTAPRTCNWRVDTASGWISAPCP